MMKRYFLLSAAPVALLLVSSEWQVIAQTTINGSRSILGIFDASRAAHTLPEKAGLVSSKPGTCTPGEVFFGTDAIAGQNEYYCTAANTWTQQLNSGNNGGDTTFPDATVLRLKDEFVGSGSAPTGELGWTTVGTGCTPVNQISVANHPGIIRQTTGSTSGASYCTLYLSQAGSVWSDVTVAGGWEVQWVVKIAAITGIAVSAGIAYPGSVAVIPPSHGYFVQYNTNESNTNWTGKVRTNTTTGEAHVDLGVAPTSSDWFRIRVRSLVAGTILFSVSKNGCAFSAEKSICASGCDATGTMDTNQMVPFVQTVTWTPATAATLDIDWFGALVTGLLR
jgi:hypothetical protein